MFLTGLIGFIFGMIAGAIVNRYLLRNVPVEQWKTNRDLKLRYGGLNWAFGIAGVFIAIYVVKWLAV
jgi:hypothetical protein